MRRPRIPLLLLLALLPSLALADGQGRAPTPMEKAYFTRVLPLLERAAPPAPADWEEVERSSAEAPEAVSMNMGEDPIQAEFHISWRNAARLEQAMATQSRAAEKVGKEIQAKHGQEMEAIMAEVEKLAEKMGQAAERGDMAAVQSHQARLEELSARVNVIGADQDMTVDAMTVATEAHDAEALLTIGVNRFSSDIYSPAHEDAPIAGLKSWRTDSAHDPSRGWVEGYSTVCLGDWTVEADGSMTMFAAEPKPGLPVDAAQTILVRVQADPARARALLEAMDWEALKSLLRR